MKNWFRSLFASPTSLRAAVAVGLGVSTLFVDQSTADKIKGVILLVGADGLRVAEDKDRKPESK